MAILVIAEHHEGILNITTHKTITAAMILQQDIHLLLVGKGLTSLAHEAAQISGVTKVLVADHEAYQYQLPENIAKLISEQAKSYHYIIAPASTFGKNLLPRVAALLDVAQLSDVIEIIDEKTFKRPMYAGNIIATVQSHDPIKVMTIRTSSFNAMTQTQPACPVEIMNNVVFDNHGSQFVSIQANKSDRPDLGSARVIVSGGRGLQSGENFALLEQLADKLGAAIGASRAAVDAGFVPNDYQVGQTGKIVAPELYIAIGISGAIQHLAGMKDSKVIVAINKDPDAPIFQVADYGLVGDLFQIIPEMLKVL